MRKRRPAKLILVCLLFGAVINVLVAWGLVIFNDGKWEERSTVELRDDSLKLWRANVPLEWKRSPDAEFVNTAIFGMETLSLLDFYGDAQPSPPPTTSKPWDGNIAINDNHVPIPPEIWFRSLSRLMVGWPLRTFESMALVNSDEAQNRVVNSTKPLSFPFNLGTHRLPYGPLWSGLIINTIFYAAIVWLMIRGPIETRRRWRELRGKCGDCGYPRGESTVCTECGSDLTHSWRRRKNA